MFKFIKNISTKNASRVDLVSVYGNRHIMKTYDTTCSSTRQEIQILKMCNHPNIIKYIEILEPEPNCIVLVFELERISLTDLIGNYYYDKWDVIRQLVEGLNYLHSNGIIHLDFKTDNIMYTGGQVKIIDMGSSEIITGESIEINAPKCTITHRPPEGYYHGVPIVINKYFDIWSLGIVIYEVLNDIPMYLCDFFPPYSHGISSDIFEDTIRSENFRRNILEGLPSELHACVNINSLDRFNIETVRSLLV